MFVYNLLYLIKNDNEWKKIQTDSVYFELDFVPHKWQ